VSLILLQAKIW